MAYQCLNARGCAEEEGWPLRAWNASDDPIPVIELFDHRLLGIVEAFQPADEQLRQLKHRYVELEPLEVDLKKTLKQAIALIEEACIHGLKLCQDKRFIRRTIAYPTGEVGSWNHKEIRLRFAVALHRPALILLSGANKIGPRGSWHDSKLLSSSVSGNQITLVFDYPSSVHGLTTTVRRADLYVFQKTGFRLPSLTPNDYKVHPGCFFKEQTNDRPRSVSNTVFSDETHEMESDPEDEMERSDPEEEQTDEWPRIASTEFSLKLPSPFAIEQ